MLLFYLKEMGAVVPLAGGVLDSFLVDFDREVSEVADGTTSISTVRLGDTFISG